MLSINKKNCLILDDYVFYFMFNIKNRINNLYTVEIIKYREFVKNIFFFNSKTKSY